MAAGVFASMIRTAIVDAIERAARSTGILIAPSWRMSQLDEEQHMRRLLRFLEIDCVFDVGANVGQHADKLRRYCDYKGLILSFEPNPVCLAPLMAAAASDELWNVYPVALGKEKGFAEFQAYEDSKLGSMLKFDKSSPHSPNSMTSTTVQVMVDTLADLYPKLQAEFGFKRPFLKLDTQGFDLQATIGAGEHLKEFLGIQSEITFRPIYQDSPSYQEVIGYYERSGFQLSKFFPNNDVHFPQLVEMDVVMIRNDQIGRK